MAFGRPAEGRWVGAGLTKNYGQHCNQWSRMTGQWPRFVGMPTSRAVQPATFDMRDLNLGSKLPWT